MVTTDLSTRYTGSDVIEFATVGLHRGPHTGCGTGSHSRLAGSQRRPWTAGPLDDPRSAPAGSGTSVSVAATNGRLLCAAAHASLEGVVGARLRGDSRAITNPFTTDGVTSVFDLSPPV